MDIIHELIARTTPDKVYQVLTDPVQIAAWYAPDTRRSPSDDSIIEFHFEPGTIRVQLTELEPEHRVVWKILQGLPGWEGVTGDMTWVLTTPFETGTMIHFTHTGWADGDENYPSVNFKIAWFITRMKSYLETGIASPAIV